jgi:hypothetical protein
MIWPPGKPKIVETFWCRNASIKHLAPDKAINNIPCLVDAPHAKLFDRTWGLRNNNDDKERKD